MAKKSLSKTQFEQVFTDRINAELDLTLKRKDGGTIIETLRNLMIEHSTDDRGCQYSGFFKCLVVKTKPRMGRNPATGEAIKIPSKIRGKLLLLKKFKDELAEAGAKAFSGKKSKKDDKKNDKKKVKKAENKSKKAVKKADKKANKSKKKGKK